MKKSILILSTLIPTQLLAQEETGAAYFLEDTNFFIVVVAGVLLALGFQLLLTALSVAGGITAVGNIRKKGHKDSSKDRQKAHNDDDDDDGMNVGQKVSTGLGAWTLITTSIALFFASLLAVKLGLIGANFIGATLGLVIWAAFFMLVTYLEASMVTSLVGGLASAVKQGLSSAGSAFSQSDASVAKDVAKTQARTEAKEMRKQLEKLFSTNDVDKKVEDYVQQLKPQKVDISNIKKQIKDLLTDLQVTEKADFDYPNSVKKLILEEADKSTLSKEDKEAVKEHVKNIKNIAQGDGSPEEKAKAGIEDLTPADRQQIDKYQEEIRKALKNTDNKELQPDKLEQDLKRILNEPKEASNIAKAKASAMDRNTLVQLLASQNMSEQEADQKISQVEKVFNKVSSFFNEKKGDANVEKSRLQKKEGDVEAKVKSMFSSGKSDLNRIYSDFTSIFQDSGAGPDLKYKLEHYNKEEMITMITNKTSLSRSEAEPIADKIVSARDTVLEKAYNVQIKVNEKMAEAKDKALIAAEESRKAAATAAWWLVATGIVSAAASAIGGMLALEGIF
ncbi:hypothetical protein [Salinimicrobium terrae]|uniref:hypothetical protein n=1 Tax=Salinimicrobium terrae TaxID=470866 RepID=UPI0003F537D7|nr:hypothetical protein [Salinimicrobium terrae]